MWCVSFRRPMFGRQPFVAPIATAACWLLLGACVQRTEYDSLAKKLADATKEVNETKQQLTETKQQLTELQAHRYQTLTNGGRTWRLDTAKGKTCLLLASEGDWKNPQMKPQSCTCEDFYRDNKFPTLQGQTPEQKELYSEELKTFAAQARYLGC